MVIQLQFDGPLKAVTDRIDLGEVVQADEWTTTITARSKEPTVDSNGSDRSCHLR